MEIQIPWELFLKKAEENRKYTEKCILLACRNWPTSKYVGILQEKLETLRGPVVDLNEEIMNLTKIKLPKIREENRLRRIGFELSPTIEYPDGRKVIFIKPGKEAYDVKKGKKEIYNPDDMLPLVLKNDSEIQLTTQKNKDATMGELARELAKIKRFDSEVFGEVCALLIRMSMYFEEDHEKLSDGCFAWSPSVNLRSRINELNDKIKLSDEPIDLWNFLLTCHAISLQEDVKYNKDFCKRRGIKTPRIGRYTHLTSMVLWGDLLGSTNDSGIAVHASKFDAVLVHNSVITLKLDEVKEIFKDHMADCSKETEILLNLESKSLDELKQYCRKLSLKVGGKKSELVQRLLPYFQRSQMDIFGNAVNQL